MKFETSTGTSSSVHSIESHPEMGMGQDIIEAD